MSAIPNTMEDRRKLKRDNKAWPDRLVALPGYAWPKDASEDVIAVFRSKRFFAQLYREPNGLRLSINRTSLRKDGRWDDNISWDELQALKTEAGFGECWAVEIYPPTDGVVNVANMRHLWLIPEAPPFAWRDHPHD